MIAKAVLKIINTYTSLDKFANKNGLKLKLGFKQNYYPDLTFEDSDGHLFAVDFKSGWLHLRVSKMA